MSDYIYMYKRHICIIMTLIITTNKLDNSLRSFIVLFYFYNFHIIPLVKDQLSYCLKVKTSISHIELAIAI